MPVSLDLGSSHLVIPKLVLLRFVSTAELCLLGLALSVVGGLLYSHGPPSPQDLARSLKSYCVWPVACLGGCPPSSMAQGYFSTFPSSSY